MLQDVYLSLQHNPSHILQAYTMTKSVIMHDVPNLYKSEKVTV